RDPVPPSRTNVEFDAESSEAGWTPPFAQLSRLHARLEQTLPRRMQYPFQMKREGRGVRAHTSSIRQGCHSADPDRRGTLLAEASSTGCETRGRSGVGRGTSARGHCRWVRGGL